MLAKILKMPPAMGVPINRQLSVSLNGAGGAADIRWSHFHSFTNRFSVGFPIRRLAGRLFKAVFVSHKGFIFEVVFSEQDEHYLCWYTKIISFWNAEVAVSLEAIRYLTGGNYPVSPTAYFFSPPQIQTGIDWVVPVVMGDKGLWSFGQRVISDARQTTDPAHHMFKPILTEEPQVLQALVNGWFHFDPFQSPTGFYPHLNIHQDSWFGFQEAFHAAQVKGMMCEINHREFDRLAHHCIQLRQNKFSVTALMSAAVDKLSSTAWITRDYVDSYWMMFPEHPLYDQFQSDMDTIFECAVKIYCKLYHIDPDSFGQPNLVGDQDISSLTIAKTMSDEVTFTFHDLLHDRHICFYSFYPLLAVSTLAAGSDVP